MKILNRSLRRLSRACTTRQGALKKLAGFSTAVLAAGMLTGCLIGTSNNAPTTPVPASASPATSVPASTYTGQDLAIFNAINLYRTKVDIAGGAGVGEVAQNTLLDAAHTQGAVLVTTAKDFVKLPASLRAMTLVITVRLYWEDEVALKLLLP